MDVLGWLWFGLTTLLGVVWSVLWFLLGGWVVTLVQLVVIVGAVFAYKYGWARAPVELMHWGSRIARFVWAWVRARELPTPDRMHADRPARARSARAVPARAVGDVNVSTLLSLLALAGLGLVASF